MLAWLAWLTSGKYTGDTWELEIIQIRALQNIFLELSNKEALIESHLYTFDVRLNQLCSNVIIKM